MGFRGGKDGTCEISLAGLFPVLVEGAFIDKLFRFFRFAGLLVFLFVVIVLFFFSGLLGEVLEDIFFVGIGVDAKEVSGFAFDLVLSKGGDLDFIGIFSGFFLVSALCLFEFYLD